MRGWCRSALFSLAIAGAGTFFWQAATPTTFDRFAQEFTSAYAEMDPDPYVLEFKDRLGNIPPENILIQRQQFFQQQKDRLAHFDREKLSEDQQSEAALIAYMIERHQEQLDIELAWSKAGRPAATRGLEGMPEKERWYRWLIKRYTSTGVSPQEVKEMGLQEVTRCRQELDRLATELQLSPEEFLETLASDLSVITDKQQLLSGFNTLDSVVRMNLKSFIEVDDIDPVHAMEWPGAGANTPPGIYLPMEQNPYGHDVFQFNFHGGRFNIRNLGWLYLHEAIPGHHLQSSIRRKLPHSDLRAHLVEGGNFEGWACYVEYHGDLLGAYSDRWQEVGKWEWDLVRSARLVLDIGIHAEGWSREDALRYWRENIPGQDAIAEREVDRVTAMPGQVLSYKVGAAKIEQLKHAYLEADRSRTDKDFHLAFLQAGQVPLEVIANYL